MHFSEIDLIQRFPYKTPKPIFVDVGGHQGTTSIVFAKKNWRVVVFEPEPSNLQKCKQRLEGFANVTIFENAVSNVSGEKVPFFTSDKFTGIHSLKPFHETHKPSIEVDTITLNEALGSLDIERIAALKIDTEGADFLAIKGLDLDQYQPEIVMVEFMDPRSLKNFGYTHHDMAEYMNEAGYKTYVSEWAEFSQYQAEGEPSQHRWIQLTSYPLDHEAAWGNLIFVKKDLESEFDKTFQNYLAVAKRKSFIQMNVKEPMKRIPGVYRLYKMLAG